MADAIRVEGLAALRKDLRQMQPDARKEVTRALKEGASVVATSARPLAPKRTGRLAASYRAGAAGNTAFVRSRLPYAAVQEFGWRARGIRPQPAVTRALDLKEDSIVDAVGDALDGVAGRNGWR